MNELRRPKLMGLWVDHNGRTRGRGSKGGTWHTADGMFRLCGPLREWGPQKEPRGWRILSCGEGSDEFLSKYRLGDLDADFPTRREALDAIALAMHLEEQS